MITTQVADRLQSWMMALDARPQGGPRWLQDLRDRGASRFTQLGFPTVRDEEWRFTNVAPITATEFTAAPEARAHKPFWSGYAASKAALEALVLCWAAEIRKFGVRVNLVEPPPLPTRLRAHGFPSEDPDRLTRPEVVARLFLELADPGCLRHGEIVRIERRNN